jgi:hypothetical protein
MGKFQKGRERPWIDQGATNSNEQARISFVPRTSKPEIKKQLTNATEPRDKTGSCAICLGWIPYGARLLQGECHA